MIRTLILDKEKYRSMARARNPYGDGTASIKILEAVKNYFLQP
jgi:UDP-N-acetylglucosamine 2-epimerase (non-hydrolysing)